MSGTQIPEGEPLHKDPEESLVGEFTSLGKNLIDVLRAAWDRPERQKLQQEIETGLVDLGVTLRKEAKAVSESPVTQRVKTEVEDLGTRVRNTQIETKVREELIGALHIMNAELAKVANVLSTSGTEASSRPEPAVEQAEGAVADETIATVAAQQTAESTSDTPAESPVEPPSSTETEES